MNDQKYSHVSIGIFTKKGRKMERKSYTSVLMKFVLIEKYTADVAELADAHDLGSCGATRGGSSPLIRINNFHLSAP